MLKIAVVMPATFADAGEYLADVRALEAAGADTIALEEAGPDHQADFQAAVLGAMAAVTHRVRLRAPSEAAAGILHRLSRGRALVGLPEGETWVQVDAPTDRESWKAVLREHEAAGATGVIVPWDPRLIDLMRNPEPDDRSDLLISTG